MRTAITVEGQVDTEGGMGLAGVSLSVDPRTRAVGSGRLDLEVRADGWHLIGRDLIWLVTTNKGWIHLRGSAVTSDGGPEQPIRLDLRDGRASGSSEPDRIALRLYPADSDPNIVGPTFKFMGTFTGRAVSVDDAGPGTDTKSEPVPPGRVPAS